MKTHTLLAFMLLLACTAQSQVLNHKPGQNVSFPKQGPKPMPQIGFKCKIVKSDATPTGNSFKEKIDIKIWSVNVKGKGEAIKFKSNKSISLVKIQQLDPEDVPHTTYYDAKTYTGLFWLDSPTFKENKKFLFHFYIAGHAIPVWESVVERQLSKY